MMTGANVLHGESRRKRRLDEWRRDNGAQHRPRHRSPTRGRPHELNHDARGQYLNHHARGAVVDEACHALMVTVRSSMAGENRLTAEQQRDLHIFVKSSISGCPPGSDLFSEAFQIGRRRAASMVRENERRAPQAAPQPADARPADARPADSASPALTILGAATVRQFMHGGDSDPLREQVEAPGDRTVRVYDAIAQALVKYRYTGPNAADPKKLVMKNNNQINDYRLTEEYNQVIVKGPESIRWAQRNGKLNLAQSDRAGIEPATCSRSDRRLKRTFPGCSHPMGPHLRALLTSRV